MVCLDQQHSGREEQIVVAAATVRNLPISDLDDFFSPDCICCLKDHNSAAAGGFGFAVEEVYYKCLQHRLQDAH